MTVIKILLVEDNPGDARLIKEMLSKDGYDPDTGRNFEIVNVDRMDLALKKLREDKFDVILLDLGLPDSQGIDTFTHLYLSTQESYTPIVILTVTSEREVAIKAVREGAQDYLVKGQVSSPVFVNAIQYAIERKETEKKITQLSRLYSVLSEINELIVRTEEPEKLFESACAVVVNHGLFRMAWFSLLDKEKNILKPIKFYGFNEKFFEKIRIYLGEGTQNLGVEAIAVHQGKHVISNDIEKDPQVIYWREELLSQKCLSCAAFPIKVGNRVIGAFNVYATTKDYFDLEVTYLLNRLADNISFALTSIRHEKQRRKAEKDLREERNFVTATLNIIAALVVVINREFRVVNFNRACEDVTGYSADEVIGHRFWDFLVPEDERDSVQRIFEETILGRYPNKHENNWVAKNSSRRLIEWSNTALLNENGEVEFIICTGIDITEKRKAEETITYLAFHDNLTGLPNRRLFFERFTQAISRSRRYEDYIGLLYIDLDNFKNINDTFGHDWGDRVLNEAAKRIKACLREIDTVCRLGGDEFAVVLQDLKEQEGVEVVGRRILETLREKYEIDGNSYPIKASIGASVYPSDGKEIDVLLRKADSTMYHIKKSGRNGFMFYNPKIVKNG